jgi:GNAT superfamily N-acetyltransferase
VTDVAPQPRFRRRLATEMPDAFRVFRRSLIDYLRRTGQIDPATTDPSTVELDASWARDGYWMEHLAATSAEDWVAEDPDGRIIGWAQSIERDGMFELTMLFVDPSAQSRGVGRGLLERAFPLGRGRVRTVSATYDPRALALYLQFGVAYLTASIDVLGAPRPSEIATDLLIQRVEPADMAAAESAIAGIEREVLGHSRREDTRFLLGERPAWLARRGGRVVGSAFGMDEDGTGPIAALDPGDLPALLATVENDAAERGVKELGFTIPMVNSIALDHVLGRSFHLDTFFTFILTSSDHMRLDRYVVTQPTFIF